MVDPTKTIRMTKLAGIESGAAGRRLKIAAYRWREYLLIQLMLSFVAGTLCYLAILIIRAIANWDRLGRIFGDLGVSREPVPVILGYIIFLAVYFLVTWLVARRKYAAASRTKESYLREMDLLLPEKEEE